MYSFIFLLLLLHFSACQLNFTSRYNGRSVIGHLHSAVNYTWTFDGEINSAEWGTKQSNVDDIDQKLVELDKNGQMASLSLPPMYDGRVSGSWDGNTPGQLTFTLSSIKEEDNKKSFICKLKPKNHLDSEQYDTVQLVVRAAPQVNLSIQRSYNEGALVKINCTASGIPEPSVKWMRNGKVQSSGSRAALLTFDTINRQDAGQYSCRATNQIGHDEYNVTLVVHYKPEGTTLTTSAAANTVTQGDSVTLTCDVTGAVPRVSQYKFYLNDTLVKNSSDSQYIINNVQRSAHYGEYKCLPHNDAGDGPEATVTLIVNVPAQFTVLPQNVTVNETNPVVMNCDASGVPTPSLTWTKNGQGSAVLKNPNTQRSDRSDAGVYVCTASNGVGQDKIAKAYVTVQYPPTIQEATILPAKSWIGQTVTLKCVSDGVPTPTLTWYKPDGNELNTVTGTENIESVKMENDDDFGEYKCVAVNVLTVADYRTVKVQQIKEPGSPVIISSASDIQATSLTVKWTAPADGGSPITAYRVVILKTGTEIKNENVTDPDTTSLSVGGLEKNTEYTIKVFARNAVFEGPAGEEIVQTKEEGVPSAPTIENLPSDTTEDKITLKWSEPENNGKEITQYTVYKRVEETNGKTGNWIKLETTDPPVRELEVELEKGKVNQFVVTATNEFGESVIEDGNSVRVMATGKSPATDVPQTGDDDKEGGMSMAIIAGAAVAGVLLIIGIVIIIVLWRRRKSPSHDDTSADELGNGNPNPYEIEDGYQAVSSREAARSLQASGSAAEPDYAQVDQSKRKKNRRPPEDQYAQVDLSKKKKRPKKKPGELDYADLDELRTDLQDAPAPGGACAFPVVRPPAYEDTDYADIAVFGVPQPEPEPTYANVPKKDVVYSNVEGM